MFFFPALAYGITTGTIRSDKDVARHIGSSMSTMGSYIVLVFFAAQFVYFFNYSNLGIVFAIKGANSLQSIGLTGIPLIVGFVTTFSFYQHVHGQCFGQMGHNGACVHSHADAY
jgi:aminobenzoyl-glutamate transport protein